MHPISQAFVLVLVSVLMVSVVAAPSSPAVQAPSHEDTRSVYVESLTRTIRENILFAEPIASDHNPAAELTVRTLEDGKIVSVVISKPSGMPAWDKAVVQAVWATIRIPPNDRGRIPRALIITFTAK